ncbi:hypothetical protein GPALN_003654 [Globodera pallida]|nr:hypothetical protein GPALN_003654 [Globodera pallida]
MGERCCPSATMGPLQQQTIGERQNLRNFSTNSSQRPVDGAPLCRTDPSSHARYWQGLYAGLLFEINSIFVGESTVGVNVGESFYRQVDHRRVENSRRIRIRELGFYESLLLAHCALLYDREDPDQGSQAQCSFNEMIK